MPGPGQGSTNLGEDLFGGLREDEIEWSRPGMGLGHEGNLVESQEARVAIEIRARASG
jgi:hypothetical protein